MACYGDKYGGLYGYCGTTLWDTAGNDDCAYVLFIDGLPYAFATDANFNATTPAFGLLGSGASSWIGVSESSLGETVGQRTVKAGLVMPGTIPIGRIDLSTGMLEATSVTFKLIDYDGTVASLFCNEDADYDVLSQDIQPASGTLAGAAAIAIQGAQTTDVRGKYIGLERIGPTGQRSYFSCFPFPRIGPHHAVNVYQQDGNKGPAPIRISADPMDHAGRWCALYRVFRNGVTAGAEYLKWPKWSDQHYYGGLVWWGRLDDGGQLTGDRTWEIRARGPESFLKKALNTNQISEWMPITSVDTTLSTEESYVACHLMQADHAGAGSHTTYYSRGFTSGILTLAGSKETWVSQIDDFIADAEDGTAIDYGTSAFANWEHASVGIQDAGMICSRDANADSADDGEARMYLCMHERVWRSLGYDPVFQTTNYGGGLFYEKPAHEKAIEFRPVSAGQAICSPALEPDVDGVNIICPADGYWTARVDSRSLGEVGPGNEGYDGPGGAPRWFRPAFGEQDTLVFSRYAGQKFRVSTPFAYVLGQRSAPFSTAILTDASRAAYFAFKGRMAKGAVTTNGTVIDENGQEREASEIDDKPFYQVGLVVWDDDAGHGSVDEDSGSPIFCVVKWMDPRLFGFNFVPLQHEWMGVEGDENFQIWCAPLATYAYNYDSLEYADHILSQILASTGTSTGWSATMENAPTFDEGDNEVDGSAGVLFWSNDVERADLGLGIPKQLVADAALSTAKVFDQLPGGRTGNINRVRYAYLGPFQAADTIESIVKPRGLAMSLAERRYGVVHLGLFDPSEADFTITQDDLWGSMESPDDGIPKQQLRAVGQLDSVKFGYRWDPEQRSTTQQVEWRARDGGAKDRFGDLQVTVEEHGLTPQGWGAPATKSWGPTMRSYWMNDRAAFYAKRHFLLTDVVVNRNFGRDVFPGAKVIFSNPWPVDPVTASYGLTSKVGIVTAVECIGHAHAYKLEILVFADQLAGKRRWAPIAQITGVSGAVLTLADDYLGHGEGRDVSKFIEPSWSSIGGTTKVRILEWKLDSYALSSSLTISSIDEVAGTITLTAAPSVKRDTIKWLLMSDYDDQDVSSWTRSHFAVNVLSTLKFGSFPTKGFPLQP